MSTCGRPKRVRRFLKKGATSPTVTLKLVLVTSAIYVHKIRDVAVVKIPGEFLTSDM